jgi:hypothetical protein
MTTKNAPAQTPVLREVDIYVFNKKTKAWQHRDVVVIPTTGDDNKDANIALKSKKNKTTGIGGYGIAGSRPRLGEAESKSGRRFRAVPTVN